MNVCRIEQCDKKAHVRGYCESHYRKLRRAGKLVNEPKEIKLCIVHGCGKKLLANGYCLKHYSQIYRHGELLERTRFDRNEIIIHDYVAEIRLYDDKLKYRASGFIDIEDVNKIINYKWCLAAAGYICSGSTNRLVLLHRMITNCPEGMEVDHVNHNLLDNTRANLRICTRQQNAMNRNCKGAYFDAMANKWNAHIILNWKKIYLGSYNTELEAINARCKAEKTYYGEFAYDRNQQRKEND